MKEFGLMTRMAVIADGRVLDSRVERHCYSGCAGNNSFLCEPTRQEKDDSDDVATEIAEVRKDVGKLADRFDEDRAANARIRILRFSDEVRHGVRHSKESFDQVNLGIDSYERYCREHKDYKNGRSVAAIANIKRVYANCLKDNDFLD